MSQNEPSGILWIISTPLGNLQDFTSRALATIRNLTVVAAEDTRQCRKIYSFLELPSPVIIRCDESTERRSAAQIIEHLSAGVDVGFMTDAGTPAISDPGWRLVQSVTNAGHQVYPIPGLSAVTTALSVCHFPTMPFTFYGFLDRKEGKRKKQMAKMFDSDAASVFFESPYRIQRTMVELSELDKDRQILVGREMTKKFEEYMRGSLHEVAQLITQKKPLGEYTIVVAPSTI